MVSSHFRLFSSMECGFISGCVNLFFCKKNAGHNGTLTVSDWLGNSYVFLWLKQRKVRLKRITQGKLLAHGIKLGAKYRILLDTLVEV